MSTVLPVTALKPSKVGSRVGTGSPKEIDGLGAVIVIGRGVTVSDPRSFR